MALAVGSVAIDGAVILKALTGGDGQTETAIVRELRLPRALCAFAVGGLLALAGRAHAGAAAQSARRSLHPRHFGRRGGRCARAMLAGVAALVTWAALVGALVSTLLVFVLARTEGERAPWTTTRLLLTGVVVAAGWGRSSRCC
jgi:iron complex transport system permease protein